MLISVLSSKISDKFAIPALLLFLIIGILAGSEGIGGLYFDNPQLAKSIGILALIFIIFSGGLNTQWKNIRPVIWPGVVLSTAGVLLTAVVIGCFSVFILKFSFIEGLLLGAIVSSTDAAAVFSILSSRRIGLKNPLKPLLEFESGSNDPMAVFLTVGFLKLLTDRSMGMLDLVPSFVLDMGMGGFIGYVMARFIIFLVNRLKLEYEGLYPVIMIALVLLTYTIAALLNGNGFLAVFVAGLIMAQSEFPNKNMIRKFHDGLAWLMQIVMFLTLGLLVFPSRVIPVIGTGFLISFILMVIARPLSVWLCLLPFGLSRRKKIMVAWVGLRGAAPIILATFPLLAGIPQAETIFNIVFFVVVTSVLIQGTSLPVLSRFLKLDVPLANRRSYPIEFEKTRAIDAELNDMIVPYSSAAAGKRIGELNVPEKCLIVLISRADKFVIPSGLTVLEEGDVLLVLANDADFSSLQRTLSTLQRQ